MHPLRAGLSMLANRLRRRAPVIHLYCLCWNEERMLPFFFRHYDPLITRYFVFDNGSTDGSLAILAAHPKVTVRHFGTEDGSLIGAAPAFYETVWHPSRGVADWVIIVDIDEHLHHPEGLQYFTACRRSGVTVIPAEGYEMVAAAFPDAGIQLSTTIRSGVRKQLMDKVCVFRPDAIRRIGFEVGRHKAAPRGRVVLPPHLALKLLHYKFLSESYVIARFAEMRDRIPAAERDRGWARHYFKDPEQIAAAHRKLMAMAKPVESL